LNSPWISTTRGAALVTRRPFSAPFTGRVTAPFYFYVFPVSIPSAGSMKCLETKLWVRRLSSAAFPLYQSKFTTAFPPIRIGYDVLT
jgi:hypothetical protein